MWKTVQLHHQALIRRSSGPGVELITLQRPLFFQGLGGILTTLVFTIPNPLIPTVIKISLPSPLSLCPRHLWQENVQNAAFKVFNVMG